MAANTLSASACSPGLEAWWQQLLPCSAAAPRRPAGTAATCAQRPALDMGGMKGFTGMNGGEGEEEKMRRD